MGGNIQGVCAFAEQELLGYRKAKSIVQKLKNDHKNPNYSHNYRDENCDEIEFYQGNSNRSTQWHSISEQHTPKNTSPIVCDGVLLTNAQCHIVPISISWYRECWTVQLNCTFETKQVIITASYHLTHQHGHNNFWYVCLLEWAFLIT